jgi:hypothetical protein
MSAEQRTSETCAVCLRSIVPTPIACSRLGCPVRRLREHPSLLLRDFEYYDADANAWVPVRVSLP